MITEINYTMLEENGGFIGHSFSEENALLLKM